MTTGYLRAIQSTISSRFGLQADLERLSEIVDQRMQVGDWADVAEYCAYLEREDGAGELESLALEFSVAETYFFRNAAHFEAVAQSVVPQLVQQRQADHRLRILSAGCSTGEEPYSLAMTLLETLDAPGSWDLEIFGIDINEAVIDKAIEGTYRPWSLRSTPESVRKRYWTSDAEKHVLDDRIRAMVTFERRNLLEDDPKFWRRESFDLVFCRNTLMYFSQTAFAAIIARFEQVIRPGGFLFLGHAESLRGLSTSFEVCREDATFYYQRGGQSQVDGRPSTKQPTRGAMDSDVPKKRKHWFDLIEQSSARIARLTDAIGRREQAATDEAGGADAGGVRPQRPASEPQRTGAGAVAGSGDGVSSKLEPVRDLMSQERYDEALACLKTLDDVQDEPRVLLFEASLLTNRGELERAELLCAQLLERGEYCAGAHYLLALSYEQGGEWQQARENDHQAIALDPTFAMPVLHLGLLARRSGDTHGAREALGRARELLEDETAHRILLFGGGFSRQALLELCRSELRASRGRP